MARQSKTQVNYMHIIAPRHIKRYVKKLGLILNALLLHDDDISLKKYIF